MYCEVLVDRRRLLFFVHPSTESRRLTRSVRDSFIAYCNKLGSFCRWCCCTSGRFISFCLATICNKSYHCCTWGSSTWYSSVVCGYHAVQLTGSGAGVQWILNLPDVLILILHRVRLWWMLAWFNVIGILHQLPEYRCKCACSVDKNYKASA
jgi:hypothetical protein